MSQNAFGQSLVNGPHHFLNSLAGQWKGRAKTWFEPGYPVDISAVQGSFKPVLGGRFMLYEYQGFFQGKALEGIALIGYNLPTGTFKMALADSFHTGTDLMFSQDVKDERPFSATGSYDAGTTPPQTWFWRTEMHFDEDNNLVLTAYNISPDKQESLATQAILTRLI